MIIYNKGREMNTFRDKSEYKYVTIPKWIMKDLIHYVLLGRVDTTPHTYDGVDDVVDVLSRMNLRCLDDFDLEVDWMIEKWIDDDGYLIVPEEFMRISPIPVWWDY